MNFSSMQSTMNIIIDRTWVLLSIKFVTNWKMITDQGGKCTGKDIQGFEIFSLMKAKARQQNLSFEQRKRLWSFEQH